MKALVTTAKTKASNCWKSAIPKSELVAVVNGCCEKEEEDATSSSASVGTDDEVENSFFGKPMRMSSEMSYPAALSFAFRIRERKTRDVKTVAKDKRKTS